MAEQLALIENTTPEWQLDERSVEVGRRGVADARRALQEALQKEAA